MSTKTAGKGSRVVDVSMIGGPSVGATVSRHGLERVDATLTFGGVWRGRALEFEVSCDRYRVSSGSLTDWRFYVVRAREPRDSVTGYRGHEVPMTDALRAAANDATRELAGAFLRDCMLEPTARAVEVAEKIGV